MDARAKAIRNRIKIHGLKVTCLNCGCLTRSHLCRRWEDHASRVRDLRCPECGGCVCALAWSVKHKARYQQKVTEEQARMKPIRRW